MQEASYYVIIFFIGIVMIFSLIKRNDAYTSFIEGAKESMQMGLSILPYLLVMYVAVAVFKASYLLDDLLSTSYIPNEIYMQGIFRPVSSHASLSLMMQTITEYGVDSNEGIIAAILQGGSDTTIYVMGLYFGVIGIKKTRHAYKIGILCDIICFVICLIIYLYIL
ncbi:MAG: hypothetical protein IJY14_01560 [Acholeplasmatales bacterium]|nr:hypothetical protein [Acholeplasmatales bacterium]